MLGVSFALEKGEARGQGADRLAPILETWELWLAMLGR
jgi:hypothetical protein